MNMGNSYVCTKEINRFVLQDFKDHPKKDYIYFFTAPSNNKTLITIEFEQSNSSSYFGLNPKVDPDDICKELLKEGSHFASKEALYDYAKSLGSDFWQIPKDKKYEKLDLDFAVKSLLSMSSFFYIDLDLGKVNHYKNFLKILDSENNNNTDYRFSFYDILISLKTGTNSKQPSIKIRIYGRLPETIITKLDKANYTYVSSSEMISVFQDDTGKPFKTFYSQNGVKHLKCTSKFFYNGVNLRLKQVIPGDHSVANDSVQTLNLNVERTTFGTICGFDGRTLGTTTNQENNVVGHPYLDHCRAKLLTIIQDESTLVSDFLKSLNDGDLDEARSIQNLNQYLDKSIYPHYINISGNLTTNDGYCIYAQRDDSVTDAKSLYCSVNGVSEVYDPLVKHYKRSDSDKPTIMYRLGNDLQSFDGELDRECTCELGIYGQTAAWSYYGFSLLGSFIDNKPITSHINILASKTINLSFDQVQDSWKSATEKAENKQLFGYSLTACIGWFSHNATQIERFFSALDTSKESVWFIFSLISGLMSLFILSQNYQNFFAINHMFDLGIMDLIRLALTLLFNLAFTFLTFQSCRTYLKIRKTRRTVILHVSRRFGLKTYLDKILGERFENSHPIIHVMTALYLKDKIAQKQKV